jgi:hypothetical protein
MALRQTAVFAIVGTMIGCPAAAADPVALIEALSGAPQGIVLMDYLTEGQTIRLGAKDALVIDYLQSCIREKITGGTVTIGAEQSVVAGGRVERQKVQCDGVPLKLSRDQAAKSGVVVFRGPPNPKILPSDIVIERRLYGASPLIDLKGETNVLVERLDGPRDTLDIKIPSARLLRGTFYDFAVDGRALSPGGI